MFVLCGSGGGGGGGGGSFLFFVVFFFIFFSLSLLKTFSSYHDIEWKSFLSVSMGQATPSKVNGVCPLTIPNHSPPM